MSLEIKQTHPPVNGCPITASNQKKDLPTQTNDQIFSISTSDISNLYDQPSPELSAKLSSQRLIATSSQDIAWEENQLNLFLKLQEKINQKKKEFEELVNGDNAWEEEKLDSERALFRMDRLLEIPKQSKLLQSLPEVFNDYVNDLLNNVLEHDSRLLNFILASTPIDDVEPLERKVLYWDPEPKNHGELITKLKESLPQWDGTGYLHYLLPGLPIVVKAKGLPKTDEKRYEGKPVTQRTEDLSDICIN